MIIDSSAVVAILRDEPDAERFILAIERAPTRMMSAASFREVATVIDGPRDPTASRRVDDFMTATHMKIAPVTEAQVRAAREAFHDYGRGSGHPARLSFADCFAYALARTTREALLFKGDDFRHTDVAAAD